MKSPESNKLSNSQHAAELPSNREIAEEPEARRETERPWPLINPEESRFIENTGGEYRGYVTTESGSRGFEDVRVSRVAYYDEARREISETFIATEAVNADGGDELRGPSDVRGFSILVEQRSRSGDQLGKSDIISLRPRNFIGRRRSTAELRSLAQDVHGILAELAPGIPTAQRRQRAEERLREEGWHADSRTG